MILDIYDTDFTRPLNKKPISYFLSFQDKTMVTVDHLKDYLITVNKRVTLQEAYDKYLQTPERNIKVFPFRIDGEKAEVQLQGELFTTGILVSPEYKSHSVGFQFSDPSHANEFETHFDSTLKELISSELASSDFTYKPLIKEENELWLKLKYDAAKTAYKTTSNVKINPKKPSDAPLSSTDLVTVTVEVSSYFNFEDKAYGICLNVKSINKD